MLDGTLCTVAVSLGSQNLQNTLCIRADCSVAHGTHQAHSNGIRRSLEAIAIKVSGARASYYFVVIESRKAVGVHTCVNISSQNHEESIPPPGVTVEVPHSVHSLAAHKPTEDRKILLVIGSETTQLVAFPRMHVTMLSH